MVHIFQNKMIVLLPHGFVAGMSVCESALMSIFIHKIIMYANHTLGMNPWKDSVFRYLLPSLQDLRLSTKSDKYF